jgi:hypothetical protein
MVVEVVISSGRPTGTAATIGTKAVRLLGERLHLAPQDILFVFHEVEPNLRAFLLRRSGERATAMPKPSKRDQLVEATKSIGRGALARKRPVVMLVWKTTPNWRR